MQYGHGQSIKMSSGVCAWHNFPHFSIFNTVHPLCNHMVITTQLCHHSGEPWSQPWAAASPSLSLKTNKSHIFCQTSHFYLLEGSITCYTFGTIFYTSYTILNTSVTTFYTFDTTFYTSDTTFYTSDTTFYTSGTILYTSDTIFYISDTTFYTSDTIFYTSDTILRLEYKSYGLAMNIISHEWWRLSINCK